MTQSELKEYLHYNPETGVFTWKVAKSGFVKVGDLAGSLNNHGYIRIKINKICYAAHRLAFLYMTGKFPINEVDHIDGVKDNNEWENLRDATASENRMNRALLSTNTSGYKGVYWYKNAKKWHASCRVNGKLLYLGFFDDPELASNVYQVFAREQHGRFYRDTTSPQRKDAKTRRPNEQDLGLGYILKG